MHHPRPITWYIYITFIYAIKVPFCKKNVITFSQKYSFLQLNGLILQANRKKNFTKLDNK